MDGAANAEFVIFFTFQVLGRGKLVAKGSLSTLLMTKLGWLHGYLSMTESVFVLASVVGYKRSNKIFRLHFLTLCLPWAFRPEFLFSCMQVYGACDVIRTSYIVMTSVEERSVFHALCSSIAAETAILVHYRSK